MDWIVLLGSIPTRELQYNLGTAWVVWKEIGDLCEVLAANDGSRYWRSLTS